MTLAEKLQEDIFSQVKKSWGKRSTLHVTGQRLLSAPIGRSYMVRFLTSQFPRIERSRCFAYDSTFFLSLSILRLALVLPT